VLYFPHPSQALPDGILAVGGDLSAERLKLAYQWGIFPWFNEEDPIVWWSPDQRFVLYLDQIKISKSMRPYLNQNKFEVSFDQNFQEVIRNCQTAPREGQSGETWITEDMISAYQTLHDEGICHSVEVWENDELIGGLYGVALGKIFAGESMFSLKSNASKFALIKLGAVLQQLGFWLIDCQIENPHLKSLGGKELDRNSYLKLLRKNIFEKSDLGSWSRYSENL